MRLLPHPLASFIALLVFATLAWQLPALYGDADSGWHLAAGDWVHDHQRLSQPEPFAHTTGDYPWLNISWMWDMAADWLQANLGWDGLALLHVFILALTLGGVVMMARQRGASLLPILVLVLAALPAFGGLLSVRPHVASWPVILLAAWLFHSWDSARLGRRCVGFGLLALAVIWANLHGSFLVWFTLAAAYGVQWLLARRWADMRVLLVTVALVPLAVTIHPLGVDIWQACWRTLGGELTSRIQEWQAASFAEGHRIRMAYPLLLFVLLIPIWRTLSIAQQLLFALWLMAALSSQRHLPVLILLTLPAVAAGFSRVLADSKAAPARFLQRKNADYEADMGHAAIRRGAFAFCAVVMLGVSAAIGSGQLTISPLLARYPQAEIATLKPYYCLRLWNHYNLGGWIIHATGGDWPVFIDGRAETAYPLQVIADYQAVQDLSGDVPAILQQYRIQAVLFPQTVAHLRSYFDLHPKWRLVHDGERIRAYIHRETGDAPCVR